MAKLGTHVANRKGNVVTLCLSVCAPEFYPDICTLRSGGVGAPIGLPLLPGAGANGYRVEIVWHRRETRRLTEKTNLNLRYSEKPAYSTQFFAGWRSFSKKTKSGIWYGISRRRDFSKRTMTLLTRGTNWPSPSRRHDPWQR
jgi:hypothetical protein